jgi:dihydrofolate reductase
VAKLISSPSANPRVYICDECVKVSNSILQDEAADQADCDRAFTLFQTPLEEATLPREAIIKRIQRLEAKAHGKLRKSGLGANHPATRRIILSAGVSLDGYIARPNGDVDFLFMPKDYSMASFFTAVDTNLLGRKTYDAVLKMAGGKFVSPVQGHTVYVFSRSSAAGERDGVIFTNQSPAEFTVELRKHPGKHVWLMGGGELARDFLKADLVDEIHLNVVPILLGEGISLFPNGFPQRDFSLAENKSYSRGLIALKYERNVQKGK